MKKILCKLGIHYRQSCIVLFTYKRFGLKGKIETWNCRECNYKCGKGKFIPAKRKFKKWGGEESWEL